MEVFSNGLDVKKSSRLSPLLISIGFHVLFAALILYFPTFGKSKKMFIPVMDISMVDEPGSLKSSGIATESVSKPDKPPQEKEPEPETKVISKPVTKTDGLEDISDAEKDKMKNRGESWTPKPSNAAPIGEENFKMPARGSGSMSGSLSLDTVYFPFMYYLNMLKTKIGENWIPMVDTPVSGAPKRVVIAFQLDRSGMVLEAEIEEPSGDDALDRSALRAVQSVKMFPSLPADYPDPTLGVHFGFIYEQ